MNLLLELPRTLLELSYFGSSYESSSRSPTSPLGGFESSDLPKGRRIDVSSSQKPPQPPQLTQFADRLVGTL